MGSVAGRGAARVPAAGHDAGSVGGDRRSRGNHKAHLPCLQEVHAGSDRQALREGGGLPGFRCVPLDGFQMPELRPNLHDDRRYCRQAQGRRRNAHLHHGQNLLPVRRRLRQAGSRLGRVDVQRRRHALPRLQARWLRRDGKGELLRRRQRQLRYRGNVHELRRRVLRRPLFRAPVYVWLRRECSLAPLQVLRRRKRS